MTHNPAQRRRIALWALALLLAGAVRAQAADGIEFIDAYNELVRMIWSRADVVGVNRTSLVLKNPAADSVTPEDLVTLQNYTSTVLARFAAPPPYNLGPWDVNGAGLYQAFPSLVPGTVSFLLVPGIYTTSGNDFRTTSPGANALRVPVLWERLEDIRTQLLRARYTRASGTWTHTGSPNERSGAGADATWAGALALAQNAFTSATPRVVSGTPRLFTSSHLVTSLGLPVYGTDAGARGGVFQITGLATAAHTITFYNWARPFAQHTTATVLSRDWDDYGVSGVANSMWTAWGTGAADASGRALSPWLGPNAVTVPVPDPWCAELPAPLPANNNTATVRGFGVDFATAIIEWQNLYDADLRRATITDTDEDGIVFVGCDCVSECEPGADPAWRDMDANPGCRFKLGVSSGLLTGGLRVQAYVTEWYEGGQPRQMLNLDEHAFFFQDTGNDWTLATVRRPSGTVVYFALTGRKAGQPIYGGGNYRMKKVGAAWELQFGGKDKVVHRFDGGGLTGLSGAAEVGQVRATIHHREVSVTRTVTGGGNDNVMVWPVLQVSKQWRDERRIRSANSSVYGTVNPRYGTVPYLVTGVDYLDSYNAPAGGIEIASQTGTGGDAPAAAARGLRALAPEPKGHDVAIPPSRLFTTRDAAGNVRDRVRIVATNGTAEIWRYGGQADPAQKVITQTLPGTNGSWRRTRRTVVLNPDQPGAHSNVTETVMDTFPWGASVTREISGPDSADPQVTTYGYHTDPADSNNYGRLRLVETPDGDWIRYAYDAAGRETLRITPFGDAPPEAATNACRVTQLFYAGDPLLAALNFPTNDLQDDYDFRPRLVIETALGHEVARTYHAYLPDQAITRRCVIPGAAYNHASNLTAIVRVETNGTFAGYLISDQREDGTLTRKSYSYNGSLQRLTTTTDTGAALNGAVTNGTRTITVLAAANRLLSSFSQDILSGLTLSDIVYARDGFGRATNTLNRRDGTLTTQRYGCCGVEQAVDADGVTTTHDYTPLKQVMASTRAGVTSLQVHDSWGNAARAWSTGGALALPAETRGYDEAGRMTVVSNASGAVSTCAYGRTAGGGRAVTVTDADGAARHEAFLRDGSPQAVTGASVVAECYAYGAAPGETWTMAYRGADTNAPAWVKTVEDMLGRPLREEFPDGHRVDYTYDSLGRLVRESDGFTTRLTAYNALGEPFRQATDMDRDGVLDLAGPDRVTESFSRVVRIAGTDVRETEARVYAADGSAACVTDSVSRVALNGTQTWSIAFGRTNYTGVLRDRANATRTETAERADGTRTVSIYSNGLLRTVTTLAADGRTVATQRHTYDALQRLATVEATAASDETRITRYTYDGAGRTTNVTETAGALTRTTAQEFDAAGHAVRSVLPDGGVISNAYDLRGQLVETGGARTYPVTFAFDDLGRMTALSTYRAGRAGPGDTTHWDYDPQRGWISAKRYADGSEARFTYRADGALRVRRWARGLETAYGYDDSGAVTNVQYSDGSPPVHYRYDRRGRVVEVRDAAGTHALAYGTDGALRSVTGGLAPDARLEYARDALGRVTNVTVTAGGATLARATYTFDAAARVAAVSDGARVVTYSYAGDGRTVTNSALGTWGRAARRFDGFDRLLDAATLAGTNTRAGSRYVLNAADQRVSQELPDGTTWTYAYDALGQLTSGKRRFADGMPVGGAQFEYTYDTIGNRVGTRNFRGQQTRDAAYVANALNQYEQRTVPGEFWVSGEAHADAVVTVRGTGDAVPIPANRHDAYFWRALSINNTGGVGADTNVEIVARFVAVDAGVTSHLERVERRAALVPRSPESFEYDTDGNLTGDGLWDYNWNAENRLVAMSSRSDVPVELRRRLEFLYDHQGRRVRKTVATYTNGAWSTVQTNLFFYDGWNVLSEAILNPQSAITNAYLWGLDLSGSLQGAGGVGGLVAATFGGTQSVYYAYDGNGNVTALLDTNGNPVAEYAYGPFGEPLKVLGELAEANAWRWSTKQYDYMTRLSYFGHRDLSHETGRWLTRDPIGEYDGAGNKTFLINDPIGQIDKLGLLLFAFDGTWNRSDEPEVPTERDTNIVRMYAAYVGMRHYYVGIGTSPLTKHIGGATGAGLKNRLEKAYGDLRDDLSAGIVEPIDIIGFSRGAATARAFANLLNERGDPRFYSRSRVAGSPHNRRFIPGDKGCPLEIRFLGIFDTVGAMGFAFNEWNPTINLRVPPNVSCTRHAMARHERRNAFRLARVAPGPNRTEMWFDGVHSDIGGGYRNYPELSFLSLAWMTAEARAAGLEFTQSFLPPSPCTGDPNCGPRGEWPGHNSSGNHELLPWWNGVKGSRRTHVP